MTNWGVLLLVLFFVLGLGGAARSGKAATLALGFTALVLTVAMAGYIR